MYDPVDTTKYQLTIRSDIEQIRTIRGVGNELIDSMYVWEWASDNNRKNILTLYIEQIYTYVFKTAAT